MRRGNGFIYKKIKKRPCFIYKQVKLTNKKKKWKKKVFKKKEKKREKKKRGNKYLKSREIFHIF